MMLIIMPCPSCLAPPCIDWCRSLSGGGGGGGGGGGSPERVVTGVW